jgi:hypothetical protein
MIAEAFITVPVLLKTLLILILTGLILYILWWAISQIPMPPPFPIVARVIFALVCVLILIAYLLPLIGISL